MPVTVRPHAEGATLALRAQPAARKNAAMGVQAGALKVAVTAAPEDGRANDAILDVLREVLGVKRSQLELVSGLTHRNKVVLVRGITPEALLARVAELLT